MVTMSTFSLLHRAPYDVTLSEWIVSDRIRRDRFALIPAATRLFELYRSVPVTFVPFLEMDFRYLYQPNYDVDLLVRIHTSQRITSISDIQFTGPGFYRLVYDNTRQETSMEVLASSIAKRSKSCGGYYSWSYRGIAVVKVGEVYVFLTREEL